jgi:ABC-type sulfate transport system substrate-binding protein
MNNKGFIEETKKILKGTSLNTSKYWKFLDSPEDQENIYHFCMRMYESLMNSSKDQFLDDDHEGMYSTLLVL